MKGDLDDFPCATFPISKQDLIQMLHFCVGGSKVWGICVGKTKERHVGKSLTFLAAKTKTVAAPPTVLRNPEQVSANLGE